MTEKLKIKIFDEEHELNYEEDIKFTEETINEDLTRQPAFYAFYSVLCAKADDEVGDARTCLEILEAQLDAQIRASSTMKKTEKQIRSETVLNSEWQEAQVRANMARKNLGILRAIKGAFEHRMNSLISLGANMRVQLANTEVKINQ